MARPFSGRAGNAGSTRSPTGRTRRGEPATTRIQETGGACDSMLSCKTDSAKLRQPGGPVSRPSISTATRNGRRKISAVSSRDPIKLSAIGLAVTDFATVARTSLQQGVFVAGFFFAGAECIGQSLISEVDLVGGVIIPRAQ